MKEPSKKLIKETLQKEYAREAEMNKVSISILADVRQYVNDLIPIIAKSDKPNKYYKQIDAYLVSQYGYLYRQYKAQIVKALNESGVEQRHLIEMTLQEPVKYEAIALYKTLPNTEPFKITNKILAEKSILKRSKNLAERTTKIIANGFDKGDSIQKIQTKIDIELGFRNADGVITQKAQALLKEGKFAHANGVIYQNYRIARTEVHRMASIQQYEVFDSLERDDKRLKLLSIMDKRTRPQSAQMNGQISDKNGYFIYPDGKKYKLGFQPMQWLIMDRETSVVVFTED